MTFSLEQNILIVVSREAFILKASLETTISMFCFREYVIGLKEIQQNEKPTQRYKNCFLETFSELTSSSSALVDELMRRPENMKLKYILEKMTLCDV